MNPDGPDEEELLSEAMERAHYERGMAEQYEREMAGQYDAWVDEQLQEMIDGECLMGHA